jgi:membrane-associated phospholipid phosphatase
MVAWTLARTLTNVLNPFAIFTALYALAALSEVDTSRALLYVALELLAAAAVAGYVILMRRRALVGDFWISARAERFTPALFLLAAFAALLAALALLDAPDHLLLLTLSMGLASTAIALVTLFFKASAHCTVAGHAATAGLFVLGPAGIIFAVALPLVGWARVALGAHTTSEVLAGAAVGAVSALLFVV